jgi:apolipoprotein N-acyltransferase
MRATVIALVCAFGLHLAFPRTGWWLLMPFSFAGCVASWCSVGPRMAALIGYATGIVFFAFGFSWFGETAGTLLGPAAPLLDIGPAFIEGPAFALTAVLTSYAAQRCDVRVVPVVAAAAFTFAEFARSSGAWGCPLEQFGLAAIDSPLRPLAAYVGVYGITFAITLIGAALGWWLLERRDARRGAVAIVACLGVVAFTGIAWAAWPARHAAAPTRRVAAVQGGISQSLKMSSDGLAIAVERYITLTQQLRSMHPTLVLWPETVITTDLNAFAPQPSALGARFARLSRDIGATLYVGSLARVAGGGLANVLYVYTPDATAHSNDNAGATARYGKEQLVPMAEYIPGPDWIRALPFANEIGDYQPQINPIETIAGATPLICWESLFGDIAHARLRDDPSLFLIATDDAWFGTTEFPYEHALAASLRAVETGRWVLRAGATGISGIVAPDGDWTQRSALGGQAVIVGDVGVPAPALYARLGPLPIGIAAGLLAFGLLLVRRRS